MTLLLPLELWEEILSSLSDETLRKVVKAGPWCRVLQPRIGALEFHRVQRYFAELTTHLRTRQLDGAFEPNQDCDNCSSDLQGLPQWWCPSPMNWNYCDRCFDESDRTPSPGSYGFVKKRLDLGKCFLCRWYGETRWGFESTDRPPWLPLGIGGGGVCNRCYEKRMSLYEFLRIERVPIFDPTSGDPLGTVSSHAVVNYDVVIDVRPPAEKLAAPPRWSSRITTDRMQRWKWVLAKLKYFDPEAGSYLRWAPVTDFFRVPSLDRPGTNSNERKEGWVCLLFDCYPSRTYHQFAFAVGFAVDGQNPNSIRVILARPTRHTNVENILVENLDLL